MDPYSPSPAGFQSPVSSSSSLVSQAVVDQLGRTKPWVRFLSVLTFIGSGFLVLGAVFVLIAGIAVGNNPRGNAIGPGMGVGIAAVYLLMAILYIFPAIKLWKYASRIADLARSYQEMDLVNALSEQRSFWKFAGIMTILLMVLYIVAIFAAVIGGAVLRSR